MRLSITVEIQNFWLKMIAFSRNRSRPEHEILAMVHDNSCYVPRFISVALIRDFWIFVNGALIIFKFVTAQRTLPEAVSSSNPSS